MYALLAVLGVFGLAIGLLLFVWGLIRRKKNKGGLIAVASAALIIFAFIITPTDIKEEAASGDNEEADTETTATNEVVETQATTDTTDDGNKEEVADTATNEVVETQAATATTDDWNVFIDELVANGESEQEKFKALEFYAYDYVTNDDEFKDFAKTIVADYMMGTYLDNYTDHKTMLTKIFKSFVVEKNATGAVKDFAFDYYQNVKYVYRGVDAIDSEAVKSNERQMDKAIEKINQ